MACECLKCTIRVNSPPTYTWLDKFHKDIAEGRVIHIADSPDGRPIYRKK